MKVNYKDIEVNIPETFGDLTMKQYLEYSKLSSQLKDDGSFSDTLVTYKIVEVLTNMKEEELDKLTVIDMNDLSAKVADIIKSFNYNEERDVHFNIDGIDYVAKNINELDNGEYITLNILKEQYKQQEELFPRLLAVLIRPGKKDYDFEKKEEIWNIEPFNKKDLSNLELRANIFMEKAKAKNLIPVLNFFLNMSEG